jgi:hypothetical protein
MRRHRVQFTVRRMMLVVAAMACTLAVSLTDLRRRDHCQWLADYHNVLSYNFAEQAIGMDPRMRVGQPLTPEQWRYRLLSEYHGQLQKLYQRAARRPLRPIPTAPPSPFPDDREETELLGRRVTENYASTHPWWLRTLIGPRPWP